MQLQPQRITPYKPFLIRLSDTVNGVNPEVQILRVGSFKHPRFGDFEITTKILSEMKMNFESNIRGIDIALDYFHESEKIAAGWLKRLELRENGTELWAVEVDWTPRARKMLAEKELRYFSPDFAFQWTDPESGKLFENVLFGGGLTNRPFVKGMEPIVSLGEYELADELSACVADLVPELMKQGHDQQQAIAIAYSKCGEKKMAELQGNGEGEKEKLKKALEDRSKQYKIEITPDAHLAPPKGEPSDLGLYGDPVNYKYPMPDAAQASNARVRFKQFANSTYKNAASKAIVHERIVSKELALGVKPSFDPKDPLDAMLPTEIKNKLSGSDEKNKGVLKMDEKDKMIEQLKAKIAELEGKLSSMGKDHEAMLADSKKMQDQIKCFEEEKETAKKESEFNVLLSEGKACAAQKEAFMKGDMKDFIAKAQPLNLSEKGSNANKKDDETSGEDKVLKLAEEKVKTGMSMGDAISAVLRENPELKK